MSRLKQIETRNYLIEQGFNAIIPDPSSLIQDVFRFNEKDAEYEIEEWNEDHPNQKIVKRKHQFD